MFRWLGSRILWGGLLILGGVLFLLQNLKVITFGGLFWAVLFVLVGVFFIGLFFQGRAQWWALIPGCTMLGVGAAIGLDVLSKGALSALSGAIILGSIGLAFLFIYLVERAHWWALIPAGTMVTLAVVAFISEALPTFDPGGVFFVGLGLTFGLVAILPTAQGRLRWAWIPAGVLCVIGLVVLAATANIVNYVWPVVLIAGGGYLVARAFLRKG